MEQKRGWHLCSWSENAEDIFVVFRENAVNAKEIVLWRNKDVLLGVELHALTKLLSLAFIFYSVAAQNVFIEKDKIWQRMQSFPRHLVRFLLFYGGEWNTCIFGVFTAGFSGERI